MDELLTIEQSSEADRFTITRGTPGLGLMENAGKACAEAILERYSRRRAVVLCGPGNNGGDGFVVARHLRAAGWTVAVFLLGARAALTGDAAEMARRWNGPIHPVTETALQGAELVVDALFGSGLSRDITGPAAALIAAAHQAGVPLVSVDIPSGIHGDTGAVLGAAFRAELTVTFFREKPGHWLLPGRLHCGELKLADIGSDETVLATLNPQTFRNDKERWQKSLPTACLDTHKYKRGHALIVSGGLSSTGAARLGARGALRIGAGLVTVASPPDALAINAAQLTAIMVAGFDGADELAAILEDKRKNAVLIGPGAGVGGTTRANVLAALLSGASVVLDADALTSFADIPRDLFVAIQGYFAGPSVLTPHEGEFARLFPDVSGDKLSRARTAARLAGGVVVFKGPDSVIAAPDGRAAINVNAGPELATAGSGDVLAGFITGLLAQGMPPFDAACAAVWIHGEAGAMLGAGLISEDLPEVLPDILPDILLEGPAIKASLET